MPDQDPRLQTGAYITDGLDLYEVLGLLRGPGVMGIRTVRVLIENCHDLHCLEYLADEIEIEFDLVRPAPVPAVPDLVDEIAWEPAPTPTPAPVAAVGRALVWRS